MDLNARRYARKILLFHLLLLATVLAVMVGAAREIYQGTRQNVIEQAQKRQAMLADQTARGIENYYQSILDDLDLMHRAEGEAAATEPAVSPEGTGNEPWRGGPAGGGGGRIADLQRRAAEAGRANTPEAHRAADERFIQTDRNPIIGRIMWDQLKGRASLLFTLDRGSPPRTDHTQLVGVSKTARLTPEEVLKDSKTWLLSLKQPEISNFHIYGDVGANLIVVPYLNGRFLVAVVPIREVQAKFLKSLNTDDSTSAWLIDERSTAMAASRPELVGLNLDGISDPDLRNMADDYVQNHREGGAVVSRPFTLGSVQLQPAMVAACPVTAHNRTWELFIATRLSDVDDIVAKLFHRALLWCVFLTVSVTAILVSTAIQMIRNRVRTERLRHELLTRELTQARQIQLAWLPDRHPACPSIDIAAINSPASHISGDFYNWFELPDGRLVVTIGDVTGHGMAAAFLMATTQLLVRNNMGRIGDPGKCLEEVNRQLCVQVFNGQFVTMLLAVLDPEQGQLIVATAGHPAPLLGDGESFQPLPIQPQLVLGVDPETTYNSEVFSLSETASLLMYTDGVVECPDNKDGRFTTERLQRALYGKYENAKEMIDRVVGAVDTFRGPRELDDDLTVVAIQCGPDAGAVRTVTTQHPAAKAAKTFAAD